MFRVILKSFKFWKYRWVTITFEDGSTLVGAMTDSTWKEVRAGRGIRKMEDLCFGEARRTKRQRQT